jgi:ubiquinone/menaquinone biosynthesis C-methylase UbiE
MCDRAVAASVPGMICTPPVLASWRALGDQPPRPAPPADTDPHARLLAGLHGRVVEIGAGTGPTFAAYPARVTEVLAVEPDAGRRVLARAAAAAASVPVTVVNGVAEDLPVDDRSADAVVCSLVLCSVADVAAMAEIRRVLRPEGQLRFFEHVIAPAGPLRALQRLAGPLWPRLADGCHPDRDSVAAITAAGFALERADTFASRYRRLIPPVPRVLGVARA